MQKQRLPPILAICLLSLASCRSIRARCEPHEIVVARRNISPALVEATKDNQIERGKPRPVIDGVGWVFGIPGKIILWDRRVENHDVSTVTERAMAEYLDDNDLDHVKVRVNQYAPVDDWRRLTRNKTMGWPYRYTLGALSVAGEAIFPGRLFGGDHYNPFTATIHLYSDVPAIALHEGGHAKDFTRRDYPGTYALAAGLPVVDLWPESLATGDVLAYAQKQQNTQLEEESYRILYPAYGTYVGGAAGDFVGMTIGLPIYAGTVAAGHVVGRTKARAVGARATQEMQPLPPVGDDGPEVRTAATGKSPYLPDETGEAKITAGQAGDSSAPERAAASTGNRATAAAIDRWPVR